MVIQLISHQSQWPLFKFMIGNEVPEENNQNLQTLVLYHMRLLGFEDMLHIKENVMEL